jgi:hypothetical protein
VLAEIDWRLVFWVNVPIGVASTAWAYLRLRETGPRRATTVDWWGNLTFAAGLVMVLVGITYGIQPYGGHTMGWTSPLVRALLGGGVVILAAFVVVERMVAQPNPIQTLLGPQVLGSLPPGKAAFLTGQSYFPGLISGPFGHGLRIVFSVAAVLCVVAAVASWMRGGRYVHAEAEEATILSEAEESMSA